MSLLPGLSEGTEWSLDKNCALERSGGTLGWCGTPPVMVTGQAEAGGGQLQDSLGTCRLSQGGEGCRAGDAAQWAPGSNSQSWKIEKQQNERVPVMHPSFPFHPWELPTMEKLSRGKCP